VRISLVFDGDLGSLSMDAQTELTDTAVVDLVDRFSNATLVDVSAASLSSGSIVLAVDFNPKAVSMEEAYAVVNDANNGNPIHASAGNVTYTSALTMIDKYTSAPTASPTAAPTASPTIEGSWCADPSFATECLDKSRPLLDRPSLDGTVYYKLAQCLELCEGTTNIGCCEFDMDRSLCYGYTTTSRPGQTVKSTRKRTVAASCIAGPRGRPTLPTTTTTPITVTENGGPAGQSDQGTSLGVSTKVQTYVLMGTLGLLALIVVGATYCFLSRKISGGGFVKTEIKPKDRKTIAEEEEDADYAFASPRPIAGDQQSRRPSLGFRSPHLRPGGRTSEYLVSLGSDANGSEFEPDWDDDMYDGRRHSQGSPAQQARSKVGSHIGARELRVFDELMDRYSEMNEQRIDFNSPASLTSSHGKRKASNPLGWRGENEIMFDVDAVAAPEYQFASEFFDIMNGAIDEQMLEGLPAELRSAPSIRHETGINLRRFTTASSGVTSYDNALDVQDMIASRKDQPSLHNDGQDGDEEEGKAYDKCALRADTDCETPEDSSEDEEAPVPTMAAKRAQNMSRKVGNTTGNITL
jgi:hypothetical protein